MVMTNRMGGQPSENRVLIIDDDAAVRRTWTIVAEAAGFEARATDDADLVREHLASWRPRLVILDLHMPGRDGIQFLGDLGAQKCKAAVVLATASDSRTIAAAVQVGRERGLNLAGTLQTPFQLDRLAKRCDEFGVDLDTIILEVTENSAMRDALHALEVLTRLRVKGFRLAMDDFGTAYSSLVQLQRMPFSELKIDRSFVINMAH